MNDFMHCIIAQICPIIEENYGIYVIHDEGAAMQAKKNFLLVKNHIEQNEHLGEGEGAPGKSKADNTLKAYSADWSDFDWCHYHGERDLAGAAGDDRQLPQ